MKLYISPGACSLASHIALREAGLPFETVKVDLRSKKDASGGDFLQVNAKGYVPALELDNGLVMTEGVAILQWAADQNTDKDLLPAWGKAERYKAIEWLNYVATEVHKAFSPLWRPNLSDEAKAAQKEIIGKRLSLIEASIGANGYLMGDKYSVADSYLFTVLNWSPIVGFDLSKFPNLMSYCERIKARPAVREAMAAEGLTHGA